MRGSCRVESVAAAAAVAAPQEGPAGVGRKGLTRTFLQAGDTSSGGDGGTRPLPHPSLRVSDLNSSSDELAGVSLADEDFQQPQLGLDVLVFAVLLRQRGAVLFLHVPTGNDKHKATCKHGAAG